MTENTTKQYWTMRIRPHERLWRIDLEPEILVVDEVLAVGDAEFQQKAIGKMQDVSKGEGRTVLFVSHNMNSVRRLCNSGMILKDGMNVSKLRVVFNDYYRTGREMPGDQGCVVTNFKIKTY